MRLIPRIRLRSAEHQQRGDTIVEVLIAVAVVSLVLTVSYATVNNSTNLTRDAQEHSQALKLAQTQIEFIRANGTPSGNCFLQNGTASIACKVNASGATPTTGQLSFDQSVTGPDIDGTYTVLIKWDTSVPGNKATLHLYYRRGEN